jgi:hypothetical protein
VYEWLLFLHVLSAFSLGAAYVVLWVALLAADRGAGPMTRTASILSAIGMLGVFVFGIWLAIDAEDYHVWDGWVLAALVLWAIAGETGRRAGVLAHPRAPLFLTISSATVLLLLADMIYKPGA